MTRADVEAALDAGKLQMMRPQGDWVPVRRREVTQLYGDKYLIPVWMEKQVIANITTGDERGGFAWVRIAP